MNRYMNAEKYNLERIYFGGCFIRGEVSSCSNIIGLLTKNGMTAYSFRARGNYRDPFIRDPILE